MTKLEIKNLVKKYSGSSKPSVDNFNLAIDEGELVAFLGPSGCGKTTILKIIAGLLSPTSGDILCNGQSMLSVPPEKRKVGMVFQKPLLFPHMSVFDNIAFGLKMQKMDKVIITEKVKTMLELVKLSGYENRKTSQLSGGQEQRVSLARGLVIEPTLFLLDEPLSALDASLRIEMRDMILSIQRKLQITSIFVTHDQEEAVMLADKIALMFDGRLLQYGTPEKFYNEPLTYRVAKFFGCVNFIPGKQDGSCVTTIFGMVDIPHLANDKRDVYLVVRNESIIESKSKCGFKGTITNRIFMGTSVRYFVQVYDIEPLQVNLEASSLHKIGDEITLMFVPEKLWAVPFDKNL